MKRTRITIIACAVLWLALIVYFTTGCATLDRAAEATTQSSDDPNIEAVRAAAVAAGAVSPAVGAALTLAGALAGAYLTYRKQTKKPPQ